MTTSKGKVYLAALRVVEALDVDATLIRMPSHVALALANLQRVVKASCPEPRRAPAQLEAQIQFARENFPKDGAEGETVWALAAAAEALIAEVAFSNTLARKCDALEARLTNLAIEDEDA